MTIQTHNTDTEQIITITLPKGEPWFLLRGQDRLASDAVLHWSAKAAMAGVHPTKCGAAGHIAMAMEKWPGRKMPD